MARRSILGATDGAGSEDRSRLRSEIETSGLFDAEFYAARHPGVNATSALDHFLDVGLVGGHQPSRDFEPDVYLHHNPDVASSGDAAVLHYIAYGRGEGRPGTTRRAVLKSEIEASGLFDAAFYAAAHPGIDTAKALDYFVDVGLIEGHQPSRDFEPETYLAHNPDVASSGDIPLLHYIDHGRVEGRPGTTAKALRIAAIMEAGLFDAEFYASRYPQSLYHDGSVIDHYIDVGAAKRLWPSVAFNPTGYLNVHLDVAKAGVDPLMHYVESGRAEGRALPPVPFTRQTLERAVLQIRTSGLFDEDFYRRQTLDLQREGEDAIIHYLLDGAPEHLEVSPHFSLKAYLAMHPEILDRGENALLHYLAHPASDPLPADFAGLRAPWQPGQRRGLMTEELVARMEATAYFASFGFTMESSGPTTHVAEAVAALAQRRPSLDLTQPQPDVSIVIPVYGQLPFVLSCIDALSRHQSQLTAEIIVSDDVSPESCRMEVLSGIPWIRYERRSSNGGFISNCNGAAAIARGRYLVLLNSDTRIVHGWLDELIGSFTLFPKAGFVGSKLLNLDGTLQEAGGLYWSDGTAWNYGRDQASADPRFNFARQVDWVSGASIAVPMAVWRQVGGFDEAYRPAYCEDVDLAFRIRERGYEVWYQPLSRVLHFEGKTHGRDETSGIKAYQVRNLKRLQHTWRGRLPGTRPGGHDPRREADRSATKRMLVIDANIHMPDRDAGSVVASQMMRAYRQLGYRQTLVPLHGFAHQHQYTEAYQREGVEVVYSPFYTSIENVLRDYQNFDYVLIYRYGIAQSVMASIRSALPLARLIFSNVDLHFLRTGREAALKNDRSLKITAAREETDELAVLAQVDCSLVHTPEEAVIVNARLPVPLDNIITFPWVSRVAHGTPGRDARRDIMFLGGFPHTPNVDAAVFFMEEVWPRLSRSLPNDARFLLVGNAPPPQVRAYASDRVIVTGHVPEVEPYLALSRVFVAPLRYGAGIKGKVIQSLSNGVPTVASSLAVEGIPVENGKHFLLADDPDSIMNAVLQLYEGAEKWESIRSQGFDFIEQSYSWKKAVALCERSLDIADITWIMREERARETKLSRLMKPGSAVAALSGP